jgi:branched-chain amino acid transport system substrate-binding protein
MALRKHHPGWTVGITAAAAAMVALSACSSSGSTQAGRSSPVANSSAPAVSTPASSSPGSSSPSSASGPATGSPIKLMYIATKSNPAYSVPEGFAAANAATASINAQGGVNGHKLVMVGCDENLDPNQEKACFDKAAQQHVSAVTGAALLFDQFASVKAAKIPILFAQGDTVKLWTDPISYPNAGSPGQFGGHAVMAAKDGAKTMSIDVVNVGAAVAAGQVISKVAKNENIKVLRTVQSSETGTDLSADAAAAARGNPDAIELVMGGPALVSMVKSLRQQGYAGKIYLDDGLLQSDLITAMGSAADGLQVACIATPTSDTSDPMVKQFLADMKKYAPGGTKLDELSELAWSGVYLYAEVMKSATAFTGPDVINALEHLSGTVTAGVFGQYASNGTPPSSVYPRIFRISYIPAEVKNGTIVATGPSTEIPGSLFN